MENMSNDECPSLNQFYDTLVFGNEAVLEATISKMGNKQLLEFYDYVVEKSEDENLNGCELYWYASLILEETSIVKMYKNGQLYVDTTLSNDNVPYVSEAVITEEELRDIQETVKLLEQRKKEKKNPIKKLIRIFKER